MTNNYLLKEGKKMKLEINKKPLEAASQKNKKAKRERFKSLAERRVNYVIDKLRLIGNLSDTRHYEYTNKDKDLIIAALQKELNNVKSRFQSSSSKKESGFTLGD